MVSIQRLVCWWLSFACIPLATASIHSWTSLTLSGSTSSKGITLKLPRGGGSSRNDDTFAINESLHPRNPRRKAPPKRRKSPTSSSSSKKKRSKRSRQDDDDDDNDDYYYPPRPSSSYRRRSRRNKRGSALNTAATLAKRTVDLTTAAAWTTLKGSGKAAYYLASPKHVTRNEIYCVWRLDQQGEREDTQREKKTV